jgi:DUF4097 and DUF4098 domain-containing protein YvlB
MTTRTDNSKVREFTCTGPIDITVDLSAGALTVTADDQMTATVRVTPYDASEASLFAADDTTVTFADDRLRIETPHTRGSWMRRNGRVRIDLRVPVGSKLRTRTGSADINIGSGLGGVVANSGSGDIMVDHVDGDVSAETGSGDIRLDEVAGAVRAQTGSGDLVATSVAGPLTVDAASGDVTVHDAHGPVRVNTASGDVRIGAARGDQVRVTTASGDASVGVPAGTRVWMELSTVSGSAMNDLTMTGAEPEGGAQLNLRIHTVSGDIAVRHANA